MQIHLLIKVLSILWDLCLSYFYFLRDFSVKIFNKINLPTYLLMFTYVDSERRPVASMFSSLY